MLVGFFMLKVNAHLYGTCLFIMNLNVGLGFRA